MKKLLIYLFILFNIYSPAFAENTTTLLSKIENNFYGFDYAKDSNQNRVARLEKTIYGKVSKGDINKRLKKLSGDVSADVIGLEIEPCEDTFLAEEKAQEDSSVSYPIVDEIEQKLFNTTYKNRDFHTRIVTIEKKLFGKIYDVEDYSSRMDRIKSKMMPETIAKQEIEDYGDGSYYTDEDINSMDFSKFKKKNFTMPFGQKKYSRPYSNYGNLADFSNKDNIPDDFQVNDELSKMEYAMFGTEFSNESTKSRLKRLNSVQKAKKSSHRYDSQKFSQHMSTAMEIGAMILMVLAMIL